MYIYTYNVYSFQFLHLMILSIYKLSEFVQYADTKMLSAVTISPDTNLITSVQQYRDRWIIGIKVQKIPGTEFRGFFFSVYVPAAFSSSAR